MNLVWDGKIGPAFIGVMIQTAVIAVGGVAFLVRAQDGIENSKMAVSELRTIVSEVQKGNAAQLERIARLEASQAIMLNTVQRIEMKVYEPVRAR